MGYMATKKESKPDTVRISEPLATLFKQWAHRWTGKQYTIGDVYGAAIVALLGMQDASRERFVGLYKDRARYIADPKTIDEWVALARSLARLSQRTDDVGTGMRELARRLKAKRPNESHNQAAGNG